MFKVNNLILLLIILNCSILTGQEANNEKQSVNETLWNYLNGRNNGDIELLSSAFHETADLRYIKNDSVYIIWLIKDYIKIFQEGRKITCKSRVISIDVSGSSAQAKIEIEYPDRIFTDYLNLLKVENKWVIVGKTFASKLLKKEKRILFVITSHNQFGDTSHKTGVYLGEVSHVYKPLIDAGFSVDFVSPKGGESFTYGNDTNDPLNLWFLQNQSAYYSFTHALKPEELNPSNYQAIYFVGGHGSMWDFPENEQLATIASEIYLNEGVVAAVCHGPAGLVNIKLDNGEYLVKNKKLTAFTDNEEKESKGDSVVPFLLESKLKERGALFIEGVNWKENVVIDGRLITGQNPSSASKLAEEIIKLLKG